MAQGVKRSAPCKHLFELSRRLAASLAGRMPAGQYLVNLCENRLFFALGLAMAAIGGRKVLLPPSQSPGEMAGLINAHPGTFVLTDEWIGGRKLPDPLTTNEHTGETGKIPWNRLEVTAFTSGSTGTPQPWSRSWQVLSRCASAALTSLDLAEKRHAVISTTPPQHMYGLETAVVWPLVSFLTLTPERPFYPEDIRRATALCPLPVVLASTPLHLKTCLDSPGKWRNLALILSSTAPLDHALAGELEQAMGAPLVELYGSTETLSFAWRRPTRCQGWRPYEGVALACRDDRTRVTAPWLPAPVELPDRFQPLGEGLYQALGRGGDLVKIGGKRHSLAELNRILLSLEGVRDGCFYRTAHGRLGALVVTRRQRGEIRAALRRRLDEVFLPRPLLIVDRIPRNATGKVVKAELASLVEKLTRAP